jgi:integrase
LKLTKATVAHLTLPPGKEDLIIFDDELKGFGIRLRAGGKRVWIAQYRIGAKQRRVTLGDVHKLDVAAARQAASQRLAAVTLGDDPQGKKLAERARAANTLGAVIDSYLNAKKETLREASFEQAERYLRKHWKPLHGLPIHTIHRRDIAARLTGISTDRGAVAADGARTALAAMFSWGLREGFVESNPVSATNRPAEPKSRDRVLTDAEIGEVWFACRDDDFGRIVQLLLLTGCRREEIGALTWQEVDLQGAIIRLPGGRTKNGVAHDVPLTPLALAIIEAVPRRDGHVHLFGEGPRRAGDVPNGFSGWSKAKAGLDARIFAARERTAAKAHKPVEQVQPMAWRLHDLRRTVDTTMHDKLGVQPHIVEAVLNHVSGHKAGVAGVYNRATYAAEKSAALASWTDYLESIVAGGPRKVVALRSVS